MKREKYVPLEDQVDERVKLLDHITSQGFRKGSPTRNQEWLLVFEALQYLFKRVEEIEASR